MLFYSCKLSRDFSYQLTSFIMAGSGFELRRWCVDGYVCGCSNGVGKALIPPLMQITGMSFSSWANTRLPEMLWACLVITVIPRAEAIEAFRDIASTGIRYRRNEHDEELEKGLGWSLRHSDLPNQPRELFNALVSRLLHCNSGLQALRPLLLLENLPGREWWKAVLSVEASDDDWETLGQAVQKTFDHQFQEATDVRWLSRMAAILMLTSTFASDDVVGVRLGFMWMSATWRPGDAST